jgi:hypothetical protein
LKGLEAAADLMQEAIRILQRNLPGGDLDDRDTITELWGLLDNRQVEAILHRESSKHLLPRLKVANDR